MLFVGIDLAWSTKNKSGIAILEGNKNKISLLDVRTLFSNNEIINFIKSKIQNKKAFIAIDAPLIVPNNTGIRNPEIFVGKLFRKYDAGAHPCNRKILSSYNGRIRGEELSKLLKKEKFKHSPYIMRFEQSRKFFEVYTHTAMVVIFKLDKIIKYKAKKGRTHKLIIRELYRYISYLKKLKISTQESNFKYFSLKDLKRLKRIALKEYEDKLDAIFCAYIAYYYWLNPKRCFVLGNMKNGYILTPIFDYMRKELKAVLKNKNTKIQKLKIQKSITF